MEHVIDDCICEGKRCTKCQELRCIGNYTKDKRLRSGLQSKCRHCNNADNKRWREANREYDSKRHKIWNEANKERNTNNRKAWRKTNPERVKAIQKRCKVKNAERYRKKTRQYYLRNSDSIKEYQKQYRLANSERLKEQDKQRHLKNASRRGKTYTPHPRTRMSQEEKHSRWRAYYHANRKYHVQRVLKWIKDNPAKHAARQAKRRTLKTLAGGSYTVQEWEELKAKYDYACLCCGKREPEVQLHADHIVPVIKGGSSYIANIQPLCRSCNSSKGRNILDFRPQNT